MTKLKKLSNEELLKICVVKPDVNKRLNALLDEVTDPSTTKERLCQIYEIGDASIKIDILQLSRCPNELRDLATKSSDPTVAAMGKLLGKNNNG